jgi:hypothetical protein
VFGSRRRPRLEKMAGVAGEGLIRAGQAPCRGTTFSAMDILKIKDNIRKNMIS